MEKGISLEGGSITTQNWNTFMGSSNVDSGNAITLDNKGNVYVAGESGASWGSPVNGYAGDWDAFAAMILRGPLTLPGIPLLLLDSSDE